MTERTHPRGGFNPGEDQWRQTTYFEMPAAPQYTVFVNVNEAARGTVSGGGRYGSGDTVTLTAQPGADSVFAGWTVTAGGVTLADASAATTTFTMPASNVTVMAMFGAKTGSSGSAPGEPEPNPVVVPPTGDDSHAGLWLGLTVLSLAGLTLCLIAWRRRAN